MRTCVGCRTRSPAGTLVRVARRGDGSLVVDRNAPGRGAWLCQGPERGGVEADCLAAALRRDAFRRAFRAAVGIESAKVLGATPPERATMDSGPATGWTK